MSLFDTINLPINAGLMGDADNFVPTFEFGTAGRGLYDYYWIVVTGCIFAFTMAIGIGANDVANSFATSVGSRTLKMWQALIIAGFCEFFGAFLLGARVTSTIKSGVINVKNFEGHDDLLMFGMLCALMSTTLWLAIATLNEFPVSTTHSIVGALVGYGLCSPGGDQAVNWVGIGRIVGGWFLAPLMSGTFAAILFFLIRMFILRAGDRAYDRVFLMFPVMVFITFTVNVLFILQKGGVAKGKGLAEGSKLGIGEIVGIAFGVGAGVGLITALVFNRMLRKTVDGYSEARLNKRYLEVTGLVADNDPTVAPEGGEKPAALEDDSPAVGPIEARLDKLFHQDRIHAAIATNAKVNSIHNNAEKFPVKVEVTFGFLQVFTASFASFAHGANDVANAIGPLAGIVQVFEEGVGGAAKKSAVPDWILVLGGAGLVVGLALFGHIIIAAVGVKLVKISPTRGFCSELSVAFIIALGSFLGLPLSSTQVAVGAIVGVGLLEGNIKESVNWLFLLRVFGGWVITIVVAATFSACFYSFGSFAPSQIYPLSAHNCIHQYAELKNATAGDPASYVVNVDSGNLLAGMYGHPTDGSLYFSL